MKINIYEKNYYWYEKIHKLCKLLWPLNRSITGNDTLKSLQILGKDLKGF